MGLSNPDAPSHQRQSMILVPMEAKGVTITRMMTVYGYDDAPHGHAEILFEDVPRAGGEHAARRRARLRDRAGPARTRRIHHCMRLIGVAERALDTMRRRVGARVAFGKPLAEQGTIRRDIAQSRIEIDQARLLTLKAAHLMDTVGNKAARAEIAMIKVVAPNVALQVLDRAIQAHGAMGVSQDTFLATRGRIARTLALADGPTKCISRRSRSGIRESGADRVSDAERSPSRFSAIRLRRRAPLQRIR
jgi:acyl-CoA dehydrogenase